MTRMTREETLEAITAMQLLVDDDTYQEYLRTAEEANGYLKINGVKVVVEYLEINGNNIIGYGLDMNRNLYKWGV